MEGQKQLDFHFPFVENIFSATQYDLRAVEDKPYHRRGASCASAKVDLGSETLLFNFFFFFPPQNLLVIKLCRPVIWDILSPYYSG